MDVRQVNPNEQLILIIDDNSSNLSVINDYLAEQQFKVVIARNGESGFHRAKLTQPNLILLDVMMPGIDGFETCIQLKADRQTAHIPVIFMTALNDVANKVKGFQVGGVDYLTKPFQHEEVLARVKTHLNLQLQANQLQQKNGELQAMSAELVKLNADKDKFFAIMAHDMKSPFLPLLGFSELLALAVDTAPREQIKHMAQQIYQSSKNVYRLLENLLSWSQLQQGRMIYQPQEINLGKLISQNVSLFSDNALVKGIKLEHQVALELRVYADKDMVEMILRNLISNALKFTAADGQIGISATILSEPMGWVEVAVQDTGVGMSAEMCHKVFQLEHHVTTLGTAQEQGTGLGLMICQEMVVKHGGRIWVESEGGVGTTVKFTLALSHG